jgi:glycosyltransferase involved in cell wall biosynthesis
MTRCGWLVDETEYVGGAEFTQGEFRAACPKDVELVDCRPGDVVDDCDVYAIHNCVRYDLAELEPLAGRPIVKYWNDVGAWLQPGVREWLDAHARSVCCSQLQAEYMGLDGALCIPPPVDIARFAKAAVVDGERVGNVSVASWRNLGKAPQQAAAWGAENGGVQFFGEGQFAPSGARPVAYDDMPELLARFETFVFLPTVLEPFGRLVAEAYAAGCEVVTNGLVGARQWIERDPELHAVRSAAFDFWAALLTTEVAREGVAG